MRRIIAVLVVVLAAVAGQACSSSDPEVSTKSGGTESTSTTNEPSNDDKEKDTTTSTTQAESGADVEVVEVGFSNLAADDYTPLHAVAGAKLVNNGDKAAVFFEVVFNFKDGAGKPVGTETAYVEAIEGGGTAYAAVSSVELTANAATVEASAIVDDDGMSLFDGVVIPLTVESVAQDEYLGLSVKGVATNPTDGVVEYASVTCILRSGGKIIGSANGSLDTMTANARVAWEATTFDDLAADAAECSAASNS